MTHLTSTSHRLAITKACCDRQGQLQVLTAAEVLIAEVRRLPIFCRASNSGVRNRRLGNSCLQRFQSHRCRSSPADSRSNPCTDCSCAFFGWLLGS